MEQYIKVESDHVHLMRGGDILIHCQWIEKIMVDLIILKKHPRIHKKFNKPIPYTIPRIMIQERLKLWKKDFWEIKEEYYKLFSPNNQIKNKIEFINITRNILSHCNVKLGQKYFLYKPLNRKKLRDAGKVFDLRKIPDQSKPVVLKIDYSKEENYFHDFNVIQSLDQNYFLIEANKLKIIYSHIR